MKYDHVYPWFFYLALPICHQHAPTSTFCHSFFLFNNSWNPVSVLHILMGVKPSMGPLEPYLWLILTKRVVLHFLAPINCWWLLSKGYDLDWFDIVQVLWITVIPLICEGSLSIKYIFCYSSKLVGPSLLEDPSLLILIQKASSLKNHCIEQLG